MSISGSLAFMLCRKKPMIRAAPATIGSHDRGAAKPSVPLDSARPKIRKVRPGESSAIPTQSSLLVGCGWSRSSTIFARTMAAIPIGTLIRKIQRQETSSTSQPPRIGPRIGATSMGTPRIPITLPIR